MHVVYVFYVLYNGSKSLYSNTALYCTYSSNCTVLDHFSVCVTVILQYYIYYLTLLYKTILITNTALLYILPNLPYKTILITNTALLYVT